MATKEAIQEGIAEIIRANSGSIVEYPNQVAFAITQYLRSQGVVKKVDRELPECPCKPYGDRTWLTPDQAIYVEAQQDMLKAGYVATEPLVEE